MSNLDAREITTQIIQQKYTEFFTESGDINPNGWEVIRKLESWFEKPLTDFIKWLESYQNEDDEFIAQLKQSDSKTFVDFFNSQGDLMSLEENLTSMYLILEKLKKALNTFLSKTIELFGRNSDDSNQTTNVIIQLVVIANRCPPELQVNNPVINLTQLKALIGEARYFYCADQAGYEDKSTTTIDWNVADDVVLTFFLTLSLAAADKIKTVKTRNNLNLALADGLVEKIELSAADGYLQDPVALVASHGFKRA